MNKFYHACYTSFLFLVFFTTLFGGEYRISWNIQAQRREDNVHYEAEVNHLVHLEKGEEKNTLRLRFKKLSAEVNFKKIDDEEELDRSAFSTRSEIKDIFEKWKQTKVIIHRDENYMYKTTDLTYRGQTYSTEGYMVPNSKEYGIPPQHITFLTEDFLSRLIVFSYTEEHQVGSTFELTHKKSPKRSLKDLVPTTYYLMRDRAGRKMFVGSIQKKRTNPELNRVYTAVVHGKLKSFNEELNFFDRQEIRFYRNDHNTFSNTQVTLSPAEKQKDDKSASPSQPKDRSE